MKQTPNFRKMLGDMSNGVVVKPLLEAYLHDGTWPGIRVFVEAEDSHSLARGPDGWFHPSTHPLMPMRMLWYYMSQPTAMINEPLGYKGSLSVTIGKVLHTFIQECLDDLGLMVTPTRDSPTEPSTQHPATRARGHFDGEMKLVLPKFPNDPRQLFEFKSRTPLANLVDDLDTDGFIAKHPAYYAQVQEYMRMTGLRVAVIIMLQTGYPWEMREYHIPYSPTFANSIADKYLTVLHMVETNEMPSPCCSPRSPESTSCMARGVCPVAKA